jgi:hypothetical protein
MIQTGTGLLYFFSDPVVPAGSPSGKQQHHDPTNDGFKTMTRQCLQEGKKPKGIMNLSLIAPSYRVWFSVGYRVLLTQPAGYPILNQRFIGKLGIFFLAQLVLGYSCSGRKWTWLIVGLCGSTKILFVWWVAQSLFAWAETLPFQKKHRSGSLS